MARPIPQLLLLISLASPPGFRGLPASATVQPLGGAQAPSSARTLIAVKVTGTKRFAQADVVAASGLRVGTTAGEDDFKRAARRLGDTGVFNDIAYSYSYSSAGTKLELQVTDADKFLPARFEDFVWFTDEELRQKVKEHIPLFNGELPIAGRLPDEVSDVLQALLVEKDVPGHVNYLRYAREGGPVEAINYSVSDVLIRVRKVEFTGASTNELPLLEAAAERVADREYSRSRISEFVEHQLLPVYHARGYLKASFGPPRPHVVQSAAADNSVETRNETFVDVALAVNSGRQYTLSSLEWSGNREIPTETLQSLISANPGQVMNMVRLADALQEVRTLYSARGYINCFVGINEQFDDAVGAVAIRLEVKEDYVYRMGELDFRGLDNSLTAKLRSAWKLRQGDVYDATYLKEYLPEANKLLPRSLDWSVAPYVTANVRDKTVDVDLQYSVKAPK
jgi:outer membrane protein assembly factor BamA